MKDIQEYRENAEAFTAVCNKIGLENDHFLYFTSGPLRIEYSKNDIGDRENYELRITGEKFIPYLEKLIDSGFFAITGEADKVTTEDIKEINLRFNTHSQEFNKIDFLKTMSTFEDYSINIRFNQDLETDDYNPLDICFYRRKGREQITGSKESMPEILKIFELELPETSEKFKLLKPLIRHVNDLTCENNGKYDTKSNPVDPFKSVTPVE